MSDPERIKTPEPAIREREKGTAPTLLDLIDFAEFDVDRTRKALEVATKKNPPLVSSLESDAKEKAEVRRVLQGLTERGIQTLDEAFGKLMRDIGSADKQTTVPETVRKQIDAQRRAVDY